MLNKYYNKQYNKAAQAYYINPNASHYKSCSITVQMYIISDTAMAAKLTQIVVLLLQHLLYL